MVSTSDVILVVIGITLTLLFNAYKILYIVNLDVNEKYPIFPWKTNPIKSESLHSWLLFHLITAFANLITTCAWILRDNFYTKCALIITHCIFCVVIMFNLFRFANTNKYIAGTINISTIAILSILVSYNEKQIYFIILLAPVWLETFAFLYDKIFYENCQ